MPRFGAQPARNQVATTRALLGMTPVTGALKTCCLSFGNANAVSMVKLGARSTLENLHNNRRLSISTPPPSSGQNKARESTKSPVSCSRALHWSCPALYTRNTGAAYTRNSCTNTPGLQNHNTFAGARAGQNLASQGCTSCEGSSNTARATSLTHSCSVICNDWHPCSSAKSTVG